MRIVLFSTLGRYSMSYSISWAHEVVSNWAKLCTRVQLLQKVYSSFCLKFYPYEYVIVNPNLLEDLEFTLALSKHERTPCKAWNDIKRIEKSRTILIGATMEPKFDWMWACIHSCARRHGKEYKQQLLNI